MNSRDTILQNIRIDQIAPLEQPPRPQIWDEPALSKEEKIKRFSSELEEISGEVLLCRTMEDARSQFMGLLSELDCKEIGTFDRSLCHQFLKEISPDRCVPDHQFQTPRDMATIQVSVVAPDYLLADTGSVIVCCETKAQRLLCYLPPTFVFIAHARMIFDHMEAAWDDLSQRSAEPERRGEFVIITGPSRTADIEKKLILGVHGPKKVIGFLIEEEAG